MMMTTWRVEKWGRGCGGVNELLSSMPTKLLVLLIYPSASKVAVFSERNQHVESYFSVGENGDV